LDLSPARCKSCKVQDFSIPIMAKAKPIFMIQE